MMICKNLTGRLLLIVAAILMGCGNRPVDPTSIDLTDFPSPPEEITAFVGNGVVVLNWSYPDLSVVQNFRIFRGDSQAASFRDIGLVQDLSFVDSNLPNGVELLYKISVIGNNGLEGRQSKTISATPAVYSVSINTGILVSNSRAVTLTFEGPPNTTLVKVSNEDSLFTNSQWQPFSPSLAWQLSGGDGLKTVFVKFRDVNGRETFELIFDSIVIDTRAAISEVTEDSGGRVLSSGDVVHFRIVTGETDGFATIDFPQVQSGIPLFDDGTAGDLLAGDGTYEVDYQVPGGAEVEDGLIVGNFTDAAGNIATPVSATRVTVRKPPKPVELIQVAANPGAITGLNLFWSRNFDTDFANYRIYRSLTASVGLDSELITIIQDQNTITYVDTSIVLDTTYYYRVYVFDNTGLFSGSNNQSGMVSAQ